jgi:hypothetical protein
MRTATRLLGIAALVAASVSCGDVVREGKSPVYLVLDSLTGASGASTTFTSVLHSDVLTLVTTGGRCTPQLPCPTIFSDAGQGTFRIVPKDTVGLASPTTNNQVTISRYHITYRRTDGHNIPGADVPFAVDGAVTATIVAGTTTTVAFELVRHVAKLEPPLVQLVNSFSIITTFAEVAFYGKDRVGNDISVTGTIQVDFGNFGDP